MNSNVQIVGNRGDVFDTLAAIDRGSFAHDLQDGMRELVQECVGTQRKGKLTIEIEIDPDLKTDSIRVSGKVKVKLPEKPKKASIFFPQQDGTLTRMSPAQHMLAGTEREYSVPDRRPLPPHDPVTGELIDETKTA